MSARAFLFFASLATVAASPLRAAETADPADFLRVVAESPSLAAAARRVQAAEERIGAAGLLPDAEAEGMLSQMNGPMGERNDMYEVNLRQPLPRKGERSAQRERARAAVAMAEADYAVLAGEIAAETAMALAEAAGAEAKVKCIEAQIARLDAVLRAIEIRLSTGTAAMGGTRLADRLTIQTRLAAMQLMIEDDRRMAADALAAARGRLGLAPDAPLPAFAAPQPGEIDPAVAPSVRLAAARAQDADAMRQMAKAGANPMTSVGLRFERERTAMGNEDTVGIAFMSELPWRGRRASRAEIKAADAERLAAEADASSASYRIKSALAKAERAERLAETARRLSAQTMARLDAEYDALIRAASAGNPGESTVLLTVELLEKATDAELKVIEAEQAARTARAELWQHLPAERFPRPIR
jgi:cobalt-zinc-cadmium efflux system outer membrane protein